ncbi:aldehyde dehydrogenase family protein, partial [Bacillus subtilis]|uniref:aldehyde dehydrogenase family protein n=1 Tax=Bacillus subtilis TaxID=1423 RepID=UPI00338F0EE0
MISYIHIRKHQPPLLTRRTGHHSKPYFIKPTIFPHLHPKPTLIHQQIFPPLLPFSKLSHFDQTLQLPNNTQYPFTPPLITNNPNHIHHPKHQFHLPNL